MRHFRTAIALLLAGALLAPASSTAASGSNQVVPTRIPSGAEPVPTTAPPDRSLDFDKGWRFVLVNSNDITDPTGAHAHAEDPGLDDSAWRVVDLPHDWSIEGLPVTGPGTGTSSATGFFQGGLGWYRKTFTLPSSMAGDAISVEFDGVYMDSAVYLNGQLLGTHAYGYTGFAFDISSLVHTDGSTPNVLAVRVQNRLPSSRWYSGSGIYRHVHLVVTDPVHVGRWGTFVTTPDFATTLRSGYADVHVRTTVDNASDRDAMVTIVSKVRDGHGQIVGEATSRVSVASDQPATKDVDIRVEHAEPWSIDQPSL